MLFLVSASQLSFDYLQVLHIWIVYNWIVEQRFMQGVLHNKILSQYLCYSSSCYTFWWEYYYFNL